MHRDDDQIVPVNDSVRKSVKLISGATAFLPAEQTEGRLIRARRYSHRAEGVGIPL